MVYKNKNICSACGCTLQTQTGVKLVATFQIICSFLLLLSIGYFLVQQGLNVIDSSSSRTPSSDKVSRNVSIGQYSDSTYSKNNVTLKDRQQADATLRMFVAYLIIFIIVGIFLLADIGLLRGAYQRIVGKCSTWCTVRYIRSVFAIIIFIAGFYKNQMQPLQIFVGVEIIINLCCVVIVQKFITELTSDEGDKDWRQSSINSNASSSSDTPWFTPATPTQEQVQEGEEGEDEDKDKKRSSVKSKSVTFAV